MLRPNIGPPILITVTLSKNHEISEIRPIWEGIYSKNNKSSPFLSWYWIKSLLKSVNTDYYLLCATLSGKAVGVGIIFLKNNGVKKVAYLNRTGNARLDQPWIEYNDFLCDSNYDSAARSALLNYCTNHLNVDELVVGASLKSTISAFSLFFKQKRTEWYSQTYQIRLDRFQNKNEYLACLSTNTRYQIKRASREYSELGELKIERVSNVLEALEWMDKAQPHHIKRWGDTRVGSGFNNTHFIKFHERIIVDNFERGNIDLLTVSFGSTVIAYLYNFVANERAYFYLSANVYTPNIKYPKPGLVAHITAIEYYLQRGFHTYDFMGGESQYKRSLATHGEPISIVRFQKGSWVNWLERHARLIKRSLLGKQTQQAIPKVRLIATGGELNLTGNDAKYQKATVCMIELSEQATLTQISRFDFTPSEDTHNYLQQTNIVFKSAFLSKNNLYVPTETEIKVIDITTMKVLETLSLECFNDLHHVIKHNDALFIANTGKDCVTELSKDGKTAIHHNVVDGAIEKCSNKDLRKLTSTKPHLAHPNYCFVIDNEVWTTRCDYMDAVTLNKPRKRIFIGDGLVHDGVVYGKRIYFTTVNGHIKVYNLKTTELHCDLDLQIIDKALNGWFRGICPVSNGKVIIAMSKARKSKRLNSGSSGSMLILVDIYKKEILQKWDVGSIGLDAVFSVIEVPQK